MRHVFIGNLRCGEINMRIGNIFAHRKHSCRSFCEDSINVLSVVHPGEMPIRYQRILCHDPLHNVGFF
jgi:hypothetical protein